MRAGALIALGLLAGACGRDAGTPVYKRADAPTEERVEDLLERMTTEEKVGQLCCLTGWEMYEKRDDGTVAASAAFGERMRKCPPGAFWATLRADPWTRKTIETGLDAGQSAEALNALQRRLERALTGRGFALERRRFAPHVTLARRVPELAGRPALFGTPAVERVAALDLMLSELGGGPPRYTIIARTALN